MEEQVEALVGAITEHSTTPAGLHRTLLPLLNKTNVAVFTGTLGGGRDPLEFLSVREHSLGVAFFLLHRLGAGGMTGVEVARLVTVGCAFAAECDFAQMQGVPMLAVDVGLRMAGLWSPARDTPPRSTPTIASDTLPRAVALLASRTSTAWGSVITPLHAAATKLCLSAHCPSAALPLLTLPLAGVDVKRFGGSPLDILLFGYYGGRLACALKDWDLADSLLTLAVCVPASVISAVQIAAYSTRTLVGVLLHGRLLPLPRFVSPCVLKAAKVHCQNYVDFASAFDSLDYSRVSTEFTKHADTFERDENLGLAKQCCSHLKRLAILQLTQTYVTLSLVDIAKLAHLADIPPPQSSSSPSSSPIHSDSSLAALAERHLLAMSASNLISCRISHSTQMVSFFDQTPLISSSKLHSAINSTIALTDRLAAFGLDVAKSKEFLTRSVGISERNGGATSGGGGMYQGFGASALSLDDEMFGSSNALSGSTSE